MCRLGGDEPVRWDGVESVGWMEKDLWVGMVSDLWVAWRRICRLVRCRLGYC